MGRLARTSLGLLALLTLGVVTRASFEQDHHRRASPFEALRWSEGDPEVRIDDVWYRPRSIHGVAVADILTYCETHWPRQREKRFGEDLVEAMARMGAPPPAAVDLELVRIEDGEAVTLAAVPMTEAKRNAIRDAAYAPAARLTRAEAVANLDEFSAGLEDRFAYLDWRGIDLDAALAALRDELTETVETAWLADRLNRLLLRFGDGHARVSSPLDAGSRIWAPFLLCDAGVGVVAVRPDRSAFVDPDRPWVATIDGEPLDDWIEASSLSVTAGSPQLVRHRALRGLRDLEALRRAGGLPGPARVRLGLAAAPAGAEVREVELELTARRPRYGAWPTRETGLVEDGIGYLRLPEMSDERIPDLHAAMDRFRETRGLVVDVRGNGGGSRGLLIALAGYLVGPEEGPWIGNVAAYRKSARFDEDHLEARFMYRADDERWTAAQRAAIDALAKRFRPEWEPGEGFSEWHYLVLDRTGHGNEYFYDRPVIVLSDAACFSATDIFLGALAGRPRVTLMGTASGGGSARSQSFRLPWGGIEVRCASMASFRPDGRMYDGRGVEVDVTVLCAPTDFLTTGGTDRVLEAALDRLGAR